MQKLHDKSTTILRYESMILSWLKQNQLEHRHLDNFLLYVCFPVDSEWVTHWIYSKKRKQRIQILLFLSRFRRNNAFPPKLIIAVAFGTVRMHFVYGCTLYIVLIGNRHPWWMTKITWRPNDPFKHVLRIFRHKNIPHGMRQFCGDKTCCWSRAILHFRENERWRDSKSVVAKWEYYD